jgi:hypothetical protein
MATKTGNVKGVRFLEEPLGANRAGIALISFDIVGGAVYTGGADTLQLGSASTSTAYENGVLSVPALTVATMLQNRRRDGRTVTLVQAMGGPAPGAQAAATNGPLIAAQSVAISSGNVTMNLFSAPTGGSAITTTAAAWDRACTVMVEYTAGYTGANPE